MSIDYKVEGYEPKSLGKRIYQGICYGIAAAALAYFSAAPYAMAQEAKATKPKAAAAQEAKTTQPATAKPIDSKTGRIIRLEAIRVEGRIQKPQAFYVLQRTNLNYGTLELKETFLPKIEKSVGRDPF